MAQAKQLYALQEVGLEIKKKRDTLAQVESQIGESQAVKQAQEQREAERKHLAERESSQKELGWQIDELQGKVDQNSQKLYGGSVRNPKELTGLQEELAQLKIRHSQAEDKFLETMEQIEVAKGKIGLQGQQLEQLGTEWRQGQQELVKLQSQLKADMEKLSGKRQSLLEGLAPPTLELYETLRRGKQGRAIARVEQGRCQGCRLNLSVTDLRRVRASSQLVCCSSCGRILFLE